MQALSLVLWLLSVAPAPLVAGLTQWVKARLQARQGPSPLQPYSDVWKLIHRRATWPETASPLFGLAPYLTFVTYILLLGLLSNLGAPVDGGADLLTPIFLIALAKFGMGLAALDTGTPLAALGGGRAMFVHVLGEPTLVALAYAYLLQATGSPAKPGAESQYLLLLPPLLISASLFGAILIEAGRLPFENSDTRLELTMIEDAIALDYGGPELAAWEWARALRLTFFFTLFVSVVVPAEAAADVSVSTRLGVLRVAVYLLLIVGLAVWEATRPKARIRAVVAPAIVPLVLALSAILFISVVRYFQP